MPTIASVVPSATDLILDIDGRNQLVGVSNQDVDRPEIAGLPRVGDYQNNDWEKLAAAKPTYLVTFFAPGREPAGLKQHADQLGITLVNVKIERLTDLMAAYDFFGEKLGRAAEAAAGKRRLQATLAAVHQRVADKPPVRTLLVLSDDGTGCAGPNTFIDDALQAAGGVNALDANSPPYPKLDREKIAALKPEAVVILMPGATPQSRARATDFWKTMVDVPAVVTGRIAIIDDPWGDPARASTWPTRGQDGERDSS